MATQDINVDFSYHGNLSNTDGPYDLKGDEGDDMEQDDDFDDQESAIKTPCPTADQKKHRSNDLNFSYHGNMNDRMGVGRDGASEGRNADVTVASGPWDLRGGEEDITEEDITMADAISAPTTAEKKQRANDLNFSYHGNMNHRIGDGDENGARTGDSSCFCAIS